MIRLLPLALASLWNRRLTAGLTVIVVALSVSLLLGVERLRNDARESFASTVSRTDLIVGARSGPVQLLLYSVFHIGDATNEVSWPAVQRIAARQEVAWVVPLSLGDSHRGFRVVGTTPDFFRHYRYGDGRRIGFAAGRPFADVFEAVVGAEVAARLGYREGARITLAHGSGEHVAEHGDKPFSVVGVLAPTGTPVDRSVLVSLESIEAIHLDWQGGAPIPGLKIAPEMVRKFDLAPKRVTAALVGLENRAMVFRLQRAINEDTREPLLAILPGVTLDQLWDVVGIGARVLLAVSALVVVVGLAGLVAVVVASLGERRRELAILRALGAGPRDVFFLVAAESVLLTLAGCVLGVALVQVLVFSMAAWLQANYGLAVSPGWPVEREWMLLGAVMLAGLLASLVPARRAYRQSLADGMMVRM